MRSLVVTAGAADFLIPGLDPGRQSCVEYKAHTALIYPHSEAFGGYEDVESRRLENLLITLDDFVPNWRGNFRAVIEVAVTVSASLEPCPVVL
jgi:hypothetical protein